MGGPSVLVYVPHGLAALDAETVSAFAADRSWRVCPPNHDVMTIGIHDMTYEHDLEEVDALEAAIGWRPEAQIQLVCHGKALVEYHRDLAYGAIQISRLFGGAIWIFVDDSYYERIQRPSRQIVYRNHGLAMERIVGPEWLEDFLDLEEPRFRK